MKIIKTNEVDNHHIFALVVGSSGSGKTTLASTLPADETLILSAESGLLSIKKYSIDASEINSFKDLGDAFKYITENKTKYKHIVIDSLTEIGEILFHELKPKYDKSKTFGLYEDYSTRMIKFLKALRDLTQYNIWILCLDKLTAKDFTEVVSLDLIQKSLSKKVPALFDEVFYLTSIEHEGENKRVLITDNTSIDFCKDRSGMLNKMELPNLGNIYNKIFN